MQLLREASNYRTFLKNYLKERGISSSTFARKVGLHRGFISEITTGKRRLTTNGVYAIEKAFLLPPKAKKLFRYLVAREELDIFPEISRNSLDSMILELQCASWQPVRRTVVAAQLPNARDLVVNSDAMTVFAACGEPGKPKSFLEILARSKLPENRIVQALKDLQSVGFVRYKVETRLYESADIHLFLSGQDGKGVLEAFIANSAREAALRVPAGFGSDKEFFFSSRLCVREEKLPLLKQAIRSAILEFSDNSIDPDGDCVAKLLVAFHL